MDTPQAPNRDADRTIYGTGKQSINRVARLALTLLPICAISAAKLPGPGEPRLTEQTMRSGGPIDPEQAKLIFDSADLRFEVIPETETINGVATLAFTTRASLDRLVIDLDRNIAPRSVAIDGVALPPSAYRDPEGKLTIDLPRAVPAGGHVTATITYGGQLHVAVRAPWDDGMVWSKTPDGRPWIASTDEGYGCDILWPCLDHPTGEPAVATLHITVPKGLKAPSNGRLLGVETLPDGRTTWNWRIKHPNTYAIALNIAPYELISGIYKSRFGNTVPLQYWYLPGEETKARALFAEFAPTLDFYEYWVGPYPFADEKAGVVETPYLGMEHQTIIAYGNAYKKAPEGFDWVFQHEFGHEWFANQLTVADWDDYWLHEGFESYMQPLYGRWREGEARYAVLMADQRNKIDNRFPIVSGQSRTEEDVYQPARGGPGQDIYYKGAWMLHTLRNLIGDRAFRAVTKFEVYGRLDPRPGNFAPRYGTTAEFERNVKRVTGRDLGWFFDVYLRQAKLPDLIETRHGNRLDLRWNAPGERPFPLPVEVSIDGRITRVPMAGGAGSLIVPLNAHVITDPYARILKRSVAIEAYQADRAGKPK